MEKITKKLRSSGDMFLAQLFETNCMLELDDLDQIRTRYNAGFYVLGAQYVWRKFRLLIKEFITSTLKPELINYLTFHNTDGRPSPFAIYDFEMLYMFGVITKKEKLELIKTLKISQNFENPFYQMSQAAFESLLELCFNTFFSKDKEEMIEQYYKLKACVTEQPIADNKELIKRLATKGYRYYATAIRTLLYWFEQDPTNEMIKNNLIYLVGFFWQVMSYEDKLFLGYLVVSPRKPEVVRNLAKELLSQGDELSYISESEDIDEVVATLQKTKCAYFGYRNNGLLLDCISELAKLDIPTKYNSMYLSILFLAAFGGDDEQIGMQSSMVKLMFGKVDASGYKYYFDFCMRYDEQVLLMLATNKYSRSLFGEFLRTLNPKVLDTTDPKVKKLLEASLTADVKEVVRIAKDML